MGGPIRAETKSRTFLLRIVRRERGNWQGQLVDVNSGSIYPFVSFLEFHRLLLTLADRAEDGAASGAQAGLVRHRELVRGA